MKNIKSRSHNFSVLPGQKRFAQVVRRVEALRRRQAESARQGQALFQVLLAQSFERA